MLGWILKIPFVILKIIFKIIRYILSMFFGYVFGWIPDFDEHMDGEAFEKYVLEILKRNGFKKLTLTKRTGDYGIDILGEYHGEKYAIQCKKYHRPVGVAAVQQVYAGCVYYEYDIPVVVTNQRFTTAAISMAEMNGVVLWDGQRLEQLKRQANAHSLFHRHINENPLHPYHEVIELLLEYGYASIDLLKKKLHYSEEKAFYVLEDLAFYDLIADEDSSGIRELLFETYEEAFQNLEKAEVYYFLNR